MQQRAGGGGERERLSKGEEVEESRGEEGGVLGRSRKRSMFHFWTSQSQSQSLDLTG